MKLCPQCEFIYEDDQSLCDMDGKELVFDRSALAPEETVVSMSAQIHERAETPGSMPDATLALVPVPAASLTSTWPSRSFAIAVVASVALVAFLFVVYYARMRQPRSFNSNQAAGRSQSTSRSTSASAPSLVAVPTSSPAILPDASESASSNLNPASSAVSSLESTERTRLAANTLSARSSAGDSHSPAIIWLTNGRSIKADEVWERREGVWYRQAGVVTFLKHSEVRSIQRPLNERPKSVAKKSGETKPRTTITQNQPSVSRPETDVPKKDSGVAAFLKKTGQILKKPFKL